MWDERYGAEGWAYGTAPNDFLRSQADTLPSGSACCLAAGEGRNAVFLAGLGKFERVLAVDQSRVGLDKALALAEERGVEIETLQTNLRDLELGDAQWDVITSIFAHVPPDLRAEVHRKVERALRPGGVFVIEIYSPAQLGKGTGGPKSIEMLASLDQLRSELPGLEFVLGQEIDREIIEGRYHTGASSVTQVVARKS